MKKISNVYSKFGVCVSNNGNIVKDFTLVVNGSSQVYRIDGESFTSKEFNSLFKITAIN